jgi:hypothetical protein
MDMVSYQAVFIVGGTDVNEPITMTLLPSDVIPNPAIDKVIIKDIPLISTGKSGISVYDSKGNLVISKNITLSNELDLQISELASGIFYYNITVDSKPIKAGSFVVAK